MSRWDTCGAQAILEANGGCLAKLSSFIADKRVDSYKYLLSTGNLDFEPGLAALTPYNSYDKTAGKDKNAPPVRPQEAAAFKPYANLCGLLALNRDGFSSQLDEIHQAILKAQAAAAPAFD